LKKEQIIEAVVWRGMNNTTKKNKKEHYEVEKEHYEIESAEWKKRLKRKTRKKMKQRIAKSWKTIIIKI
jgi:hypothetical protein